MALQWDYIAHTSQPVKQTNTHFDRIKLLVVYSSLIIAAIITSIVQCNLSPIRH